MKRHLYIFIFLITSSLFQSCSDTWDRWEIVTINVRNLSGFTSNDLSKNKQVLPLELTVNGPWTITVVGNWMSVDKVSGNGNDTINITIEENTGKTRRTGSIKIQAGEFGVASGNVIGNIKNYSITQNYR